MLIGNKSVLNKSPARSLGGVGYATSRPNFNNSNSARNMFQSFDEWNAYPNGYVPPYCWIIAQQNGGMAIYNNISGFGATTASNLAGGLNAVSGSDLSGIGNIANAGLGLIVSAIASIVSSGSLTAGIFGKLEALASIFSSGSITGALGAIAYAITNALGYGYASGTNTAQGSISINITSFTDNSAENVASKVWSTIAANYTDVTTMGGKLNAASSAGDPWSTALPGSYPTGSAGYIMSLIESILKNKIITDPVTGIMTVYADNGSTLLTAQLYEDAAGTITYRGQGSERREKLT